MGISLPRVRYYWFCVCYIRVAPRKNNIALFAFLSFPVAGCKVLWGWLMDTGVGEQTCYGVKDIVQYTQPYSECHFTVPVAALAAADRSVPVCPELAVFPCGSPGVSVSNFHSCAGGHQPFPLLPERPLSSRPDAHPVF